MEQKRSVQYLATFAVALAAMTSSASFSWTTPVIPNFHNNETDIRLTDTEISWLVAAVSPGVIIGSLVARSTSDRYGRRATLLGTALPFTIGTILIVTATKAWQFWLARFCWGLGNGSIGPVPMIYISEIATKEIRGKLSIVNRYMFTFGSFLVLAVGSVASYQALSYMIVALSVCYFTTCLWTPESPYYLLKEGKIAAAKKALMKLHGYKDEKVLEEKIAEMRSHVREEMKNSGTFKELLTGKQYRRAVLISVGLRFTHVMSGSIPVRQYMGRILQETNSDISVSMGMILYGGMSLIASVVASFLVDKVGRRPLLIYSYFGAFLTLTSLGIIFFSHEVLNKTSHYFGYMTLFSLVLFTTVCTLGFDTVNFVLQAEIFPLNVKSTALTSLNILVSGLTFMNMRGYQVIKDFSGLYGVLWLYACFALAGAVFSYVVVPETKGKSLREIQLELQGEIDEASEKFRKDNENIHEINSIEKVDEATSLKS